MGLLLLSSKKSTKCNIIWSLEIFEGFTSSKKQKSILFQGLLVKIRDLFKQIIFLYVRETPNKKDTLAIADRCKDSDVIMGDLNLNPIKLDEKQKIKTVGGESRCMALNEKTTKLHHQLDHVLINPN